jgi:predicted PurR-regulated permease PerM
VRPPGARGSLRDVSDREREARRSGMPGWVPAVIKMAGLELTIVIVVGGLALTTVLFVLDRLSSFISILIVSLFLSFALEPGVSYLAKRGWRRGAATGLIFVIVLLMFSLIVALIVPAIVTGVSQLVSSAPELVTRLADLLRPLGINISQDQLIAEIRNNAQTLGAQATKLAGGIVSITSTVLGGLFRIATIGLFTFYMVAEGPKLRRVICSALPPARQERVLFIWETAIEQTGGYFYSRLLLAIINGTGMYIVLKLTNVPFAAPLALFEGVVAEFIPIVGTYIGGAAPILVAFLTSTSAGIASLAYVLVYQQIENYFLSPRLTARTMSLHPAVAFGAALIGGAMGGLFMAFLALPAAGVAQAAVKEWGRRYEVVGGELTEEPLPPPERRGIVERIREGVREADDEG